MDLKFSSDNNYLMICNVDRSFSLLDLNNNFAVNKISAAP